MGLANRVGVSRLTVPGGDERGCALAVSEQGAGVLGFVGGDR